MRDAVHGESACSSSAWNFCRAGELWERLKPATPYGSDYFSSREAMKDAESIESAYDDVDALGDFMRLRRGDGSGPDRIGWHLSRMPRLPAFEGGSSPGKTRLDEVELFQFKKFLSNYRAIVSLSGAGGIAKRFGLEFESQEAAAALDAGGSDPESFMISERHEPDLRPVRMALREIASEISAAADRLASSAREAWGLDFAGREFLVVPAELALAVAASCGSGAAPAISVEPYDEISFRVRILPDAGMLELERKRETLREREAELEGFACDRLSALLRAEAANIERYMLAARRLDVARARLNLAAEFGLIRPRFDGEGFHLAGGCFLPCKRDCESLGTAYTPLDIDLRESAAVLFGSNMGGKTIALQTMVFFQVIAQCGLYVPAERFSTRVYNGIEYVGEGSGAKSQGLSGFGFEIRALSGALALADRGPCLIAFDEFARTTSSGEAESLLSAVIEAFAGMRSGLAVFATHFRGVSRAPGARFLRMAGLDLEVAKRELSPADPDAALGDRIRKINGLMRYLIEEDAPGGAAASAGRRSDAIEIASLLGLDPGIVARAAELFGAASGGARKRTGE